MDNSACAVATPIVPAIARMTANVVHRDAIARTLKRGERPHKTQNVWFGRPYGR